MAISRTVNALLRANYKTIATTVLGLLVTLATVAAAGAAEIKVFSTIGFRAILQELGPQFEKTSGHKLTTTFDVAAALKRRVEAGEPFDIAVLTVPIMSDLIRQGKIVANTRIDLARGG